MHSQGFKYAEPFIPCEHYKWFPVLELKSLLGFEEQRTYIRPTQKKKQKENQHIKGSLKTCYCRIFICLIHKKKWYFAVVP